MAKYIAKRVALALVTLVIVSMLTFFLMFLVPGGPFLSEKSPSPAVLAAMEEKYGLDKPVIVQYKNYMPPAASRCRALLYVPYYCIYSA